MLTGRGRYYFMWLYHPVRVYASGFVFAMPVLWAIVVAAHGQPVPAVDGRWAAGSHAIAYSHSDSITNNSYPHTGQGMTSLLCM